ncbi:hypothetical protein GCM10009738_11350 [Kitasatospora viridis]
MGNLGEFREAWERFHESAGALAGAQTHKARMLGVRQEPLLIQLFIVERSHGRSGELRNFRGACCRASALVGCLRRAGRAGRGPGVAVARSASPGGKQ